VERRRQSVSVVCLAATCLILGGCNDEIVTPGVEAVSLEIVPTFAQGAAAVAVVDQLHIIIATYSLQNETSVVVKDTTVSLASDGSADVDLTVPFQHDPETYLVTLEAIRSSDGFAIYGGSNVITITRDQASEPQSVSVEVFYLGAPASRVEISPRDTIVQAGANFTLTATAYGPTNQMIPALFTYSLVNAADASLLTVDPESGAVSVAGAASGQVLVRVSTPDGSEDQALISIGPFQPLSTWIVDPNTAQPAPTQFGTAQYPFATITQGLNRAGEGDTVFVAIAVYPESINSTRSVVLLGETTGGNFPIVTSQGALGSMTAPGSITIKNIFIQGAVGPLSVQGNAVKLDSVYLQAGQGTVLDIAATPTVDLYEVYVAGTTGTPAARGIQIANATTASIRRILVTNTPGPGMRTDNVTTLEVVDSEFSLNGTSSDTSFALEVVGSDSVRVDTTNFVDNYGGAAASAGSRVFVADFNDVIGNHYLAVEPDGFTLRSAFFILDAAITRITNSFFSFNTAASVFVLYQVVDGDAFIQNNSFEGRYWGFRGFAPDTLTGHVEIRNNSFVGSYTGPENTNVIGAGDFRAVIVDNNQILGAFGHAVSAIGDSVFIQNNTIAESNGGEAIGVARGRLNVIDNNNVACTDLPVGNMMTGIGLYEASGTISNNTVTGCLQGSFVDNSNTGLSFTVNVTNNTFQTAGLTPPEMGVQIQGSAYTTSITGNTIQGGAYDPFGGISVFGYLGPIASATVTGNILSSGTGRAIGMTNVNQLVLDNNSVSGFAPSQSGLQIVAQLENLNTTARVRTNQFTNNTTQGIYITGVASDVLFQTNNIANNAGPGLWMAGSNVITAQLNTFQGQSSQGVLVTQTGGTFQMNNFETNGVGFENQTALTIDATNNWWNDPNGPSGCSLCSGQSAGDQLLDPNNSVTFLPAATTRVVGAPDVRTAAMTASAETPAPPSSLAVFVDATAPGNAAVRRIMQMGGIRSATGRPIPFVGITAKKR